MRDGRQGRRHPFHPIVQARLARLKFAVHFVGDPQPLGRDQQGRVQRAGALGDPGIDHLHRRAAADLGAALADVDALAVERVHQGRAGSADVEARRHRALARRASDDPAIDGLGAGRPQDPPDRDRGLRRDGVAIGIGRRLSRCRHRRGRRLGLGRGQSRRHDRQHDIGLGDHIAERARVPESRGPRTLARGRAAPFQRRDDVEPVFVEGPTDGAAHFAGAQYCDGLDTHGDLLSCGDKVP